MIDRRNLLLGASCAVAAGAAYQLRPRNKLNLLGDREIETVIPAAFGAWTSRIDAGLIQPDTEGSLAARLYSQTLTRIYLNEASGAEVMMLVAYGDNQSDLLQLHRPEACYPAVGFRIVMTEPAQIPIGEGAMLPARRVTAAISERRENIIYWTRLGEYLPIDAGAQRQARLLTAMKGYVADGGLFRCSMVGSDDAASFAILGGFVAQLLRAVAPGNRPALVGSELARTYVA